MKNFSNRFKFIYFFCVDEKKYLFSARQFSVDDALISLGYKFIILIHTEHIEMLFKQMSIL